MKTVKIRNLIISVLFGLYKTIKASSYEQTHSIINDAYAISLNPPYNINMNNKGGNIDYNFGQFDHRISYNGPIYSQKQQVFATSQQDQSPFAKQTDLNRQYGDSFIQQQNCQPDCPQTQHSSFGQNFYTFTEQQSLQTAFVQTEYDPRVQQYKKSLQQQTLQPDCTQMQYDSHEQQIHPFPQQQFHQAYFEKVQYGMYNPQGSTVSNDYVSTSNETHCDFQFVKNKMYNPDSCQHSFAQEQSNTHENHYDQSFQDLDKIITSEDHGNVQNTSFVQQSYKFGPQQDCIQQQSAALSNDFYHLVTSQPQFDEGKSKNTGFDNVSYSTSYDTLDSQTITLSKNNLPSIHDTVIPSKRCLDEDLCPGNDAKKSKMNVHTSLLDTTDNCIEKLLTSIYVQQDSMLEELYCLQQTTAEKIDARIPTYEENFLKIATDYSRFESLEAFDCFDLIQKAFHEFHFDGVIDLHNDLTIENLNDINWSIDYSSDEKNEIKKFEHELEIIFYEMNSSIPYDLSLGHIEKLILDSKKYVETERSLFSNLKNELALQKYILNIISKIFKENELNLSMMFCEIQSLKTLIFLNYKTIFCLGNMLQLVYLFKIIELYSKQSEVLRKHILNPIKFACNNLIKPTRYILRRIIIEILYILSVSHNHIRLFSIISHLDLLIYKIIEANQIKKPLVKKIFLFDILGSIFFISNSDELNRIYNGLKIKFDKIYNKHKEDFEPGSEPLNNCAEKTLKEISEIFYSGNFYNGRLFLKFICKKFIFLINTNTTSDKFVKNSKCIKYKNFFAENVIRYKKFSLLINNIDDKYSITIDHVKFIYMIYGHITFFKLAILKFGVHSKYHQELQGLCEKIFN